MAGLSPSAQRYEAVFGRDEAAGAGLGQWPGIARAFNTSQDTLRRWIEDDPALQEALELGREVERMEIDSVLKRAAKKGNIVAAMFLLKTRHGYREGDQSETANKVSINFTLPAALKPEQFTVIEHEARTENLPVSRPRITRT